MKVDDIPFVRHVGIKADDSGVLRLAFSQQTQNHLQTFHAGAQFILAETASGDCLQTLFPELVAQVIPLLRNAQVKYKKPALSSLSAQASVTQADVERFRKQFASKGRGNIDVEVDLLDAEGNVTCQARYSWFVSKLP